MPFAENLNYLTDSHGITNYRLAQSLSVSQTSVANWKKGGILPHEKTQRTIANFFGISLEELTGDELPPIVPKKEPAPKDGDGLTERQREAVEIIKRMSDEQLKAFIAAGNSML